MDMFFLQKSNSLWKWNTHLNHPFRYSWNFYHRCNSLNIEKKENFTSWLILVPKISRFDFWVLISPILGVADIMDLYGVLKWPDLAKIIKICAWLYLGVQNPKITFKCFSSDHSYVNFQFRFYAWKFMR